VKSVLILYSLINYQRYCHIEVYLGHSPCKNSSFKLTSVSLQLVSMFVYATEEVRSSMHIKHNPSTFLPTRFPFRVVPLHLNPLGSQCATLPSPLPPSLTSDFIDTMTAQLRDNRVSRLGNAILGQDDFFNFDPTRTRYPLRSEALNIFDRMMRGIVEELADKIHTLMV